jgi:hypothetical protein
VGASCSYFFGRFFIKVFPVVIVPLGSDRHYTLLLRCTLFLCRCIDYSI